jgi:hypothetical protein
MVLGAVAVALALRAMVAGRAKSALFAGDVRLTVVCAKAPELAASNTAPASAAERESPRAKRVPILLMAGLIGSPPGECH